MTDLLYQTDSYLREFDATVVAVDAGAGRVALDRSAFYPGGGGQPGDVGVLTFAGETVPVTQVKKEGDLVWHWLGPLPAGSPLLAGEGASSLTRVRCSLDWERRYQLMRTHTAMHILCGVVWRDYGASVTGGNMDPLQGRMDFRVRHLTGGAGGRDRGEAERRRSPPRVMCVSASCRGRRRSDSRPDPHQDQPAAGRDPGDPHRGD